MTAAPGLTALLGGALFRRRRRTAIGLVAVASLFTAQAGCGPETPMSEGTESGTSESSTGPAMSTGHASDEVSARMFGKFHHESDHVGQTVAEPPGEMVWYVIGTIQINRDGTVANWSRMCQDSAEVQTFTWTHVGDDVLQIIPAEYRSDGTFKWYVADVTAVTVRPGPGCGDIEVVSEYLPDSGQSTNTERYLPGEVCADGDSPGSDTDCNFTIVWCDGVAPPACTGSEK